MFELASKKLSLHKYQLHPFWDDAYTRLEYVNETFNDLAQLETWKGQGFANQFTGDMCDMRSPQPSWNQRFIEHFTDLGWKDIGTSYYRMMPGTILPTHGDLYVKYIKLFNLQGLEHTIRRAIVFLEDWQSGHYFEGLGQPMTQWSAGQVVEWIYDTPHLAANMGSTPRYTLQITGHVND
jgi:hypothetical protein